MHQGRLLRGADASSFEVRVEINAENASTPQSWILLGHNFSRDFKYLYFANDKLEGLEVIKFLEIPEKEAKALLVLHQEALYKRKLSEHEVSCIYELSLM